MEKHVVDGMSQAQSFKKVKFPNLEIGNPTDSKHDNPKIEKYTVTTGFGDG